MFSTKIKVHKGVAVLLLITALVLLPQGKTGEAASHSVSRGETLWSIAKSFNITIAELQKANGLTDTKILPGQVLQIPVKIHTVKPGDNLSQIAYNYGVSLASLKAANPDITSDKIFPGQKINLPKEQRSETLPLPSRGGRGLSTNDVELLARLVCSEAAGEPYVGQVAVSASVLNRVNSPLYPNTISEVIYQITNGCYQYSPVLDGRINMPANSSAYRAVEDALKGWDPSYNALGFYNPQKTGDQWVRSQTVTTTIGNHVFFR
ncbi:MAG: LysM peptidoglycan-binding domain-containing protein [Dethiobacteria bacterium]|jgi:N-acetylmuramoyl-L-alanine amidase